MEKFFHPNSVRCLVWLLWVHQQTNIEWSSGKAKLHWAIRQKIFEAICLKWSSECKGAKSTLIYSSNCKWDQRNRASDPMRMCTQTVNSWAAINSFLGVSSLWPVAKPLRQSFLNWQIWPKTGASWQNGNWNRQIKQTHSSYLLASKSNWIKIYLWLLSVSGCKPAVMGEVKQAKRQLPWLCANGRQINLGPNEADRSSLPIGENCAAALWGA